ncbi:Uncharacterised protein [Vibrio furnissii]|nr:Uncharacterised protein [Vibrio furnissii]
MISSRKGAIFLSKFFAAQAAVRNFGRLRSDLRSKVPTAVFDEVQTRTLFTLNLGYIERK